MAQWFVQKLRKPCPGSRIFGFKTMKVNKSECGLKYFIQKIPQYTIFEIKLFATYKDYIAVAYLWYHRPRNYEFQK